MVMFFPRPSMMKGGDSVIHHFIPEYNIYSSATAGWGYCRITHGGITTANGSLYPNPFDVGSNHLLVDAIIWNHAYGLGMLFLAVAGYDNPANIFTSIKVPGVHGNVPLLSAGVSNFGNVGGYNATFWQWTWADDLGAPVEGDVIIL